MLRIVLLIALVYIGSYIWDIQSLEIRENILSDTIYRLSLAFISSYIFYFIVVEIKERRDRKNIYNFIGQFVFILLNDCNQIIDALKKTAKNNSDIRNLITKEEMDEIIRSIPIDSKAPLIIFKENKYADWIEYFNYYVKRDLEFIAKINCYDNYLDSDFINIISKIEHSTLFVSLIKMKEIGIPTIAHPLYTLSESIYQYYGNVLELNKYAQKYLLKYYPQIAGINLTNSAKKSGEV